MVICIEDLKITMLLLFVDSGLVSPHWYDHAQVIGTYGCTVPDLQIIWVFPNLNFSLA